MNDGGYKAKKINGIKTVLYYADHAMTILHREDGPAVETVDGYKEWWIEGHQYTEEEFNKIIKNNE